MERKKKKHFESVTNADLKRKMKKKHSEEEEEKESLLD